MMIILVILLKIIELLLDNLSPGESISISIDETGTFRIIDPDYPWMEISVYSFPESSTRI